MSITPPPLPPDPSQSNAETPEAHLIPQPNAFAHLGEEPGTGKDNLPPAKLVGIILGVLIVAIAIAAFVFKAKSPASGTIDQLQFADVEGQNSVMVAITVTIHNNDKTEYKMHAISSQLDSSSGANQDEHPASASDFDRYLQAFPVLKTNALPRLQVQTIEPGGQRSGTILVSFPVNAAEFASRKSLKVTITAFGETIPLVMAK